MEEKPAIDQEFRNKFTYTNVYCLELEDGYYYIGSSRNIESRFYEHLDGDGSMWTSLHKPIRIIEVLTNVNTFEEDRMVKQYMSVYGIDKVRGGTYISEKLSEEDISFIQKEIWSAQQRCIRCGRSNHLMRHCHAQTDVNGIVLYNPELICAVCDRAGHLKSQCKARTKQDGSTL